MKTEPIFNVTPEVEKTFYGEVGNPKPPELGRLPSTRATLIMLKMTRLL